MKTYLPQIERRIIVRQNNYWGILSYDLDNAYPQRMLEFIFQSPTAQACWEKRSKFLGGNGFEVPDLGKVKINKNGLTLAKLLKNIATDKALFTGFCIHVNYNANYKISSLNYVSFEDIRMGDPENSKTKDKYALYSDWGKKTWKSILSSKITYIDKYNSDPNIIKQQVIDAGGWEKYKGQLFYFNPKINDYPLIKADSASEDFETEAGIKLFNNREITNGFLPSSIIAIKQRREAGDVKNAEDNTASTRQPSQLEKDFAKFQGVKNAQNIILVQYEDEESKPEIVPFPIQNNDRLFEITEKSVEARIIKAFSIPKELINSEKSSGLSNGGEKKEAIREFNDETAPERLEISEALEELFSNYWQNINPKNNWGIVEVPNNVADDMIGKVAGSNINQLLVMGIPKARKVAILVSAYNFKQEDAELMVPEDNEIKDISLIEPPKSIEE